MFEPDNLQPFQVWIQHSYSQIQMAQNSQVTSALNATNKNCSLPVYLVPHAKGQHIFTDVGFNSDFSLMSLGCFCCNEDGTPLWIATKVVHPSKVIVGEALAVRYGLQMGHHYGSDNMFCYSDSKALIRSLVDESFLQPSSI